MARWAVLRLGRLSDIPSVPKSRATLMTCSILGIGRSGEILEWVSQRMYHQAQYLHGPVVQLAGLFRKKQVVQRKIKWRAENKAKNQLRVISLVSFYAAVAHCYGSRRDVKRTCSWPRAAMAAVRHCVSVGDMESCGSNGRICCSVQSIRGNADMVLREEVIRSLA